MTTKTRPSLPKGKPNNGISQWDNEGGAPSSGDRSRKQGGRPQERDKPAKKASCLPRNLTRIPNLRSQHQELNIAGDRLMGEIVPALESSQGF